MSSPKPQHPYEVVDLEKMCEGGLFREKIFRDKLSQTDWGAYEGKDVLVKGCGNIPIPTWAYMAVSSRLVGKASKVLYGEAGKPISVFPGS